MATDACRKALRSPSSHTRARARGRCLARPVSAGRLGLACSGPRAGRGPWDAVFRALQSLPAEAIAAPINEYKWPQKNWCATDGKDVKPAPSRFTSGQRGKRLIDLFAVWFFMTKDTGGATVNFQGDTLVLPKRAGDHGGQVLNARGRRSCTHIPMQIQRAVPDHGAMLTFPAAERGRWAAVAADFQGRHGIEAAGAQCL